MINKISGYENMGGSVYSQDKYATVATTYDFTFFYFLIFEPRNRNDKVPFDLTTFRYVPISQAAEIPNKVKAEIIAILRDTGAPI
jgi:hypothetical protein